ncbi:MAG: hypothetical protein MHM6MM_008516, partial [Cercozoa sp. M6MM]
RAYGDLQDPLQNALDDMFDDDDDDDDETNRQESVARPPGSSEAIPNPWSQASNGAGTGGMPMGGMPMGGMPMGGMPMGGMQVDSALQMMRQPGMRQLVAQLMSDDRFVDSLARNNPQAATMLRNPMTRAMFSNPDMMQHMMNLMDGNASGGSVPLMPFGMPMQQEQQPVQQQSSETLRRLYTAQLATLRDMGFTDDEASLRALASTGGNVQAAVNRLLGM